MNSTISDYMDSDDDATLKNKNNTCDSSVQVGIIEEEVNKDRGFIPVKRRNSSSILRKCIIYQPDLICKDESASVKEQRNHILYYYSQKNIDLSTMTTQYCVTSPKEEEEAIQFSGLCNAISNFTTLVSTIENTTTTNNNTTTTATTDPTEVYLSDSSILIYVRLFPFRNEKNYCDNGIMSVLQIQQESQDDIIDCKSLRFILQKSMELFLLLHNVSPTKKNVFQQNKCIFTNYYNKVIDDINNNFFSSNNMAQYLNAPLLSPSFHFLHSILQFTPPSTTQSLMKHNTDDRSKRCNTLLCLKLKLQRCIHELFQQLIIDDTHNNHNSSNSNDNSKRSSNEFKIMGASLFYNHNLLESFLVSECFSCSSSLLKEDNVDTIIADEPILLLLYKCMLTTLGSKLNDDYTHEIHNSTTSDSSNIQKKCGEREMTTSTGKRFICTANSCSSFDDGLHNNEQYQYYHKKSGIRNHGKFYLFTSTSHDHGNTYFIWAPKIYNSFFTRIVFFHNDELNWNMMLYLKDIPVGDWYRYDGDFIPTSSFFEKLSTTINAAMADAFVPENSLKTKAVAGNSNFGSPLYGRIEEGTYMIVAIDRCMKRSVIMLPNELILGNSNCIVNNEASERQRKAIKNATTSFTLTPIDIKNPLSCEGYQEFSLIKPSDKLRCTLAAILPKEIMLALDDTMNEIQLGITTCGNDSANYSLQDETTPKLLSSSGGGVCELCTLITLTQNSYKGSRSGDCGTVWICGRKLGSRELYVALDATKYKTVRQVQYALSRIRTDLVHLPYS